MSDIEDPAKENHAKLPPPPGTPPATASPGQPSAAGNQTSRSGFGGVAAIVRRWKTENLLMRGSLVLRSLALCFSTLAFIIMATNKHGNQYDWRNFDKYEEYRYLLAIAILSTLYTGGQVLRQIYELHTGKTTLQPRTWSFIDFFGDQTMAYLLLSASSAAIPKTNEMRGNVDNIFTDALAAATSMAFLAFAALAVSAGISGYKLSTQSYI